MKDINNNFYQKIQITTISAYFRDEDKGANEDVNPSIHTTSVRIEVSNKSSFMVKKKK